MILGWLRGPTRVMGIDLNPQADIQFNIASGNAPDAKARRNLLLHGTLVHERTHWLHFLGTSSGWFHMAVWESQALAAKEIVFALSEKVDRRLFPLSQIERTAPAFLSIPRVSQLLDCWIGLENMQSYLFGASATIQIKAPKKHSVEFLASFLRQWLVTHNPVPSPANQASLHRYNCPKEYGEVSGIQKDGFAAGTYQVTEAVARLNEFAVLSYGLERQSPDLVIEHEHLFDGVYGHARDMFYKLSEREIGHVSEAILAVLAHEALNSPLPPLASMSTFSGPWLALNPYHRLAEFTRRTKHYKPREYASIGIPQMQELRAELRDILLSYELVVADGELAKHATGLLSGFAGFEIPADLYTVKDGRAYPVDYMRYKYLGRLFYNAFRLYEIQPDFLTFPAVYYISERNRFRELFNEIRPPVLFAEGEGFMPTHQDPAAHAVLMLDVFVNEILRSAMYYRYPRFLDEMRGIIKHSKHQKYTEDAFSVGLLNAGFSEAFACEVCSDLGIEHPNF